jgi:hypothetical protein
MCKLLFRFQAVLAALLLGVASASAQTTLQANPSGSTNNGLTASGAGIFFNLSAATALTITGMTTASSAAANATFSIEIFTRMGTALGGPVGSGPGSSPAGWTSLGMVTVTQGATANDISLPIDLPDFSIAGGQTVGVAIVFTGAGPRYVGTGAPPLSTFSDANLSLVTGDARTVPFTTTGSFFSSRALTGSITYMVVPEPSSFALIALAGAGWVAIARRRSRFSRKA